MNKDRLLVSTRKGLFTVDRSASGWRIGAPSFLGDPVSLALADPRDGTWYAALNLGHFGCKLRRSTDQGNTWEEVGVPAYPPQPEADPAAEVKDKTPWKLMQIWALEAVGKDELWCGTIPGGLFRSKDRGATWSMIEPLWRMPERLEWFGGGADQPGIHSVCVDPRDSGRVAVGISCGGVWQTRDGGDTWHIASKGMRAAFMPPDQQMNPNIQDPHRVVQCAGSPQVFWSQHHNGIFRSTDDCESWHEITTAQPSSFGFALAVHPKDPDTAWFVPAVKDECRVPVDGKLVATRTRDGGKSFEVLRKGLPQEHAYDLVYRHGLALDDEGRCLAMGSTSGGLWVSEDQGDSWTELSTTLPPIYAVRFA